MAVNRLIITQANVHKLTLNEINCLGSKEYWHKFVIENGAAFDRNKVLKAILDFVNPIDLVPVQYEISGKDAYFLARNCNQVIEKFFLNSLAPVEIENNVQVTLHIQMCYILVNDFKVNMQHHLKQAIEKRRNLSKNSIDLSAFHQEPELNKMLFCPLSKPRFLLYVLSILKKMLPITSLNLSNNDIEDLKPLEILEGFPGLISLNLSNNKVSKNSCIELLGKTVPTLNEINLNENPICSYFKTEKNYVEWIRKCFPFIKKIDDIDLHYGLPQQKFWLCDNTYWPLINEFIRQYFTLYDFNRKALEFMYHKSSVFSITCDDLPAQDFLDPMLKVYKTKSTALLKLYNKYKIVNSSHFNNLNIVRFLCELPRSQHDPSSFQIDLLQCDEPHMTLVISGLFKDFFNVSALRSFHRTFVLLKDQEDEYKIINEIFHVRNACQNEFQNDLTSETYNKTKKKLVAYFKKQEKRKMTKYLAKVTKMNLAFSTKCLVETDWNLKKAFEIFLENFSASKVPAEAFNEI